MPTYGYQCTQCKHEFQVFQSMKDDPIAICPECGGAVKRLLYPVGVVFKGSGWYINDSRKPDKSADSGETKSDSAKPADSAKSSETGSTESKSETKATPTSTKAEG